MVVRPTHDEIIRELTRDVTILKERLETVRRETGGLPDLTKQVALLQQRVEDMGQGWERRVQRAWMVVGPLVGGATGALLTYYLRKP